MHRTVYRLLCLIVELLVLRGRRDRSKDAEILVLRHQVAVLSRQRPRPRFTPEDRGFLAGLFAALRRDQWRVLVVRPATVLGWHRRLVARHWTQPDRSPGRPPTAPTTRALVLRLAGENPDWGYRRIHGEVARVGITVGASTVWAILKRAGIDPSPGRAADTWRSFLASQAAGIVAFHPQPHRRLDHPNRPEPHHDPPETSAVRDPGRCRPVHRRLRPGLRRPRRPRRPSDPHPGAGPGRQRLCASTTPHPKHPRSRCSNRTES